MLVSASLPRSMWSFYLFFMEEQFSLQIFWEENDPYVAIDSMCPCPREEVSSASSCAAILDPHLKVAQLSAISENFNLRNWEGKWKKLSSLEIC